MEEEPLKQPEVESGYRRLVRQRGLHPRRIDLQPAVTSPACLVDTRSGGQGFGLDTYHNMTGRS